MADPEDRIAEYELCAEEAKKHGIEQARQLRPDVRKMVEECAPTVFGAKWAREMTRIRNRLFGSHKKNLHNVLKLSVLLYEYGKHVSPRLLECAIASSDHGDESAVVSRDVLSTPDSYVALEGMARVFMDTVSNIDKPSEILEMADLPFFPDEPDLFMGISIVWFFQAAELYSHDSSKALDLLCESSLGTSEKLPVHERIPRLIPQSTRNLPP